MGDFPCITWTVALSMSITRGAVCGSMPALRKSLYIIFSCSRARPDGGIIFDMSSFCSVGVSGSSRLDKGSGSISGGQSNGPAKADRCVPSRMSRSQLCGKPWLQAFMVLCST